MKRRHVKGGILCIVLVVFAYLIYIIFFKTTYAGGYLTSLEVPTWLRGELPVSSCLADQEPGPVIESEQDYYGVFKVRFFDANTQEQITDKAILDQIMSMFIYTDDPFVYDETRSIDGACFFYYNGALDAYQSASLFSGFNGSGNVPGVLKGIDAFYMKYHAATIPASFSDTIEEALDEFL